jgi:hypothetical protein
MLNNHTARAWVRRGAGLLLVSLLTGSTALPQGNEKPNRVVSGAAAEIGQPVPGPSVRAVVPAISEVGAQDASLDSLKARQQRELRKLRFDKMKEHATQLAEMAKSLQEEIEKSNENVLSLDVVEKAKKIEKLAKKIRDEARYGQ